MVAPTLPPLPLPLVLCYRSTSACKERLGVGGVATRKKFVNKSVFTSSIIFPPWDLHCVKQRNTAASGGALQSVRDIFIQAFARESRLIGLGGGDARRRSMSGRGDLCASLSLGVTAS